MPNVCDALVTVTDSLDATVQVTRKRLSYQSSKADGAKDHLARAVHAHCASERIARGDVMSVDHRVMKTATLLAFLAVGAYVLPLRLLSTPSPGNAATFGNFTARYSARRKRCASATVGRRK